MHSILRLLTINIAVIGIGMFAAALLVYVVDPLQFYRQAWYVPVFGAEREQSPGLAKNYEYDTLITGSSHTQNFSLAGAKRALGVHALKLSLSGAAGHEIYLLLRLALAQNKAKTVILAVDASSYRGNPDRVVDAHTPFPQHFYDQNPFNEISAYLLSSQELIASAKILASNCCRRTQFDTKILEDYDTWFRQFPFGRTHVLADWRQSYCRGSQPKKLASYEARIEQYDAAHPDSMLDSLKRNLVALIKEHPKVRFVLFFPPYTTAAHASLKTRGDGAYDKTLRFKQAVYDLAQLSNVEVYDFQRDSEITRNLELYKDLNHYSEKVNQRMLELIAQGRFRVTDTNRRSAYDQFLREVDTYSLAENGLACIP